jgi:hypothetical protein
MSIDRRLDLRRFVLRCNGCHDPARSEHFPWGTEFSEIAAVARKRGWKATQVWAGRWEHKCPKCEQRRILGDATIERMQA